MMKPKKIYYQFCSCSRPNLLVKKRLYYTRASFFCRKTHSSDIGVNLNSAAVKQGTASVIQRNDNNFSTSWYSNGLNSNLVRSML